MTCFKEKGELPLLLGGRARQIGRRKLEFKHRREKKKGKYAAGEVEPNPKVHRGKKKSAVSPALGREDGS